MAAPFGILSYHRIAAPALDPWQLAVSPVHFAGQLATLGGVGGFVPLDHAAGARRHRPGRRPRFAVTFDDGYADNLVAALPVLERHDVPATVFVSTGYLDRDAFWWDMLDHAVLDPAQPLDGIVDAGHRVGLLADGEPPASRIGLQSVLHAALATRPAPEVDPLVSELLSSMTAARQPLGRPLTTAQLVELAAHPLVSIGVHTVHHVRLPRATAADARRELREATAVLDTLLGPARRALAYPHGDTNPTVAALAAEVGFTCAVTTEHRWVRPGDDRMLLPRLTVVDEPGPELQRRLEAAQCR